MDLGTVQLLMGLQTSIGGALSKDQQLFVSQQYPFALDFFNSDAGREATRKFVEAWVKAKSS